MLLSACGQAAAPEASEPADTEAEAAPTTEAAAPAEAESSEPAAEAEAVGEGYSIGISMPTKSSSRWISDGESMVQVFEEKGYTTDLQYAEDDIPNQLAQIENMVTKGVDVLVIAAIDGTTLSDVLQQAADQGIKV
ncbi:MAG: substrate-binding domain-containing protein, partial [Anaerolineae bacterium]|nr:substrate-binding domain-containing protein [Anaerolineae bacterium]